MGVEPPTMLYSYQWLQGATSSIPRKKIGNHQVAVPLIISHMVLVKARTPCHPVVNGTSFGGISAFYNARARLSLFNTLVDSGPDEIHRRLMTLVFDNFR